MRQFLVAAALCAAAVAWLAWSAPEWLETARNPSRPTVASLERNIAGLERQVATMEQTAARYAKWRTCVCWVPANEVGDADNRFGYLFGDEGAEPGYRPAIAVDRGEWDDPDYEFLAFAGRDRPFTDRECEGEPGEGVD